MDSWKTLHAMSQLHQIKKSYKAHKAHTIVKI